jgi:hypothetical protein
VVYRKSNRYAKKRAGQKLNFLIIFLIFFEFFEIGLTGRAEFEFFNKIVAKLL